MAVTSVEGVHHIGVPVKDLQASMDWYRDLFGIEPEFVRISEGPEGPELDAAVGLAGVSVSVAFLRVGNTLLELLQYHAPQGEPFRLRNCDIGALHVCFQVEDIHAAHAALVDAGVAFSVEPTRLDYGRSSTIGSATSGIRMGSSSSSSSSRASRSRPAFPARPRAGAAALPSAPS